MKTRSCQRWSCALAIPAFICVLFYTTGCSERDQGASERDLDQPFEVLLEVRTPLSTPPETVKVTIDGLPAEWQVGTDAEWATLDYSRAWPSLAEARDEGLRLSVSLVGDERVLDFDMVEAVLGSDCVSPSGPPPTTSRLDYLAVKGTDPVSGADMMALCQSLSLVFSDGSSCALSGICGP